MSDNILDKSEFDYKDELLHPKIIPIILRPGVVFPFQVTHLEFHDEIWKKVLDKAHEEPSVIGLMYSDEETEDLPVIGRVATSAVIDEINKTVSGSYIVKFVPINRFFTKEYVETEPVLMAEVSYYGDQPEDDTVINPLLERFLKSLNRMGKIARSKNLETLNLEQLREDIQLYSFSLFRNCPKLTKQEELQALWMYKLSLRLAWLIELLESSLNDNVERIAATRFDAQNN